MNRGTPTLVVVLKKWRKRKINVKKKIASLFLECTVVRMETKYGVLSNVSPRALLEMALNGVKHTKGHETTTKMASITINCDVLS